MNRIYKVLFNKTLGVYAAVSELASVKGKKAAKALAVGTLLALSATQAQAVSIGWADGGEHSVSNPSNTYDSVYYATTPAVGVWNSTTGSITATEGDNTIKDAMRGIQLLNKAKLTYSATEGNNTFVINNKLATADSRPLGIGLWTHSDLSIASKGDTTFNYIGDAYYPGSWNLVDAIIVLDSTMVMDTNNLTIDGFQVGIEAYSTEHSYYYPGLETGKVTVNAEGDVTIRGNRTPEKDYISYGLVASMGGKITVDAKGDVDVSTLGSAANATYGGDINITGQNITLENKGGTNNHGAVVAEYGSNVNLNTDGKIKISQSDSDTSGMAVWAVGWAPYGETKVTMSAKTIDLAAADEAQAVYVYQGAVVSMTADEKGDTTSKEAGLVTIKGKNHALRGFGDGTEISVTGKNIEIESTAGRGAVASQNAKISLYGGDTISVSGSYESPDQTYAAIRAYYGGKVDISSRDQESSMKLVDLKGANGLWLQGGNSVDPQTGVITEYPDPVVTISNAESVNIETSKTTVVSTDAGDGISVILGGTVDMKNVGDVTVSAYKRGLHTHNGGKINVDATGNIEVKSVGNGDSYAALYAQNADASSTKDNDISLKGNNITLDGFNGIKTTGPMTHIEIEAKGKALITGEGDVPPGYENLTRDAIYVENGDHFTPESGLKDVKITATEVDIKGSGRGVYIKNGGQVDIQAKEDVTVNSTVGDNYAAIYTQYTEMSGDAVNVVDIESEKGNVLLEGFNGIKSEGKNTAVKINAKSSEDGKGTVTIEGMGDKTLEETQDGIHVKEGGFTADATKYLDADITKDVEILGNTVDVKGKGRGINVEDGGDILIKADKSVLASGAETETAGQVLGGVRIMNEGQVEITNRTDGKRMDSVTLEGSNGIDVTGATGKKAVVKVSGSEAVDIKALESKDDNDPDGIYVKTGGEVEVKDVGTVKVTGQKRGIHIEDGGKVTIDADGNVDVDASVGQNYAAVYVDNKDETASDLVDIKSKADITLSGYNGIKAHGYDTVVNVEAGEKGTVTITGTPDAGALIEGNTRDGIHVSGNKKSGDRPDVSVKGYDVNIAGDGRGILSEDGGTVDIKADNTVKISGSLDDQKDNNYAAIRVEKTGGQVDISSRSGNRMEEVSLYGANGMRVLGNPDDPNVSSSVTIS